MRAAIFVLIVVAVLLLVFIALVIYYLYRHSTPNVGSKCSTSGDCRGGSTCDPIAKVCRIPLRGVCSNTSECISGTSCIGGRCIALKTGHSRPINTTPPSKSGTGGNNVPITAPNVGNGGAGTSSQISKPELPGGQPPPTSEVIVQNPATTPAPSVAVEELKLQNHFPSRYPCQPTFEVRSPPGTEEMSHITGEDCGSTGCSADFSIRSQYSTEVHTRDAAAAGGEDGSSDSGRISTPYLQQGDLRYCKCGADISTAVERAPPELITRPGRGVVDAISYSKMTIFLHQDGRITWEQNGRREKVRCNIKAQSMEKHGGYLYALSSGLLYRLNNNTLNSASRWMWQLCEWCPAGIVHTSSTLDGRYFWIQDSQKGYLYNQYLQLYETV